MEFGKPVWYVGDGGSRYLAFATATGDGKADLVVVTFVRWDRYLRVPVGAEGQYEMLTVYGWIDRDDDRSDFVVLFPSYDETPGFVTSSAKHSAAINSLLYKDVDPTAPHYECERIDDFVGDLVPNRVAPFAPGRGKT